MSLTFAFVAKAVATHFAKKAVGRYVDSHIPKSVKKASKIYSAVKKARSVTKKIS